MGTQEKLREMELAVQTWGFGEQLRPRARLWGTRQPLRLTFPVQRSTHRSTDMFLMVLLASRAKERFSGRRKQPRKMALPSGERSRGRFLR